MARAACLMLLVSLAALAAACSGDPVGPAQDSGGEGVGGLVISGLRVEQNPNNVLSCVVSWRTNLPASEAVEFGAAGQLSWRVRGTTLGTQHRLLVIGLHQRTAYELRAVSVTPGGARAVSARVRHVSGDLPAYLPHGRVVRHDPRRALAGWTLMSVNAARRKGLVIYQDEDFTPTAVMYDMAGRPVWYQAHGLGRIGDTRLEAGGRVLVQSMADVSGQVPSAREYDLSGKAVWTGPDQPALSVTGSFHHHFDKLSSGNYLTVTSLQRGLVVGDVVLELTPTASRAWSWSAFEHLRPDTTKDDGSSFLYSWTHINALAVDAARDVLYINARNISTVFKVRRSSGEILWALGRGGDFAADPAAQYPWFEQPHGLELLPNGNLMMYDNGLLKRGFSRAVEYAIDEASRTARIVWQYRGGLQRRWFVNYWGDADRLSNGNTLITAGTWKQGHHSRLTEVTRGGEVVWEMELPVRTKTGNSVGVYNSQRITPPLLERMGR